MADGFCGPEVDDQLERGWLFDTAGNEVGAARGPDIATEHRRRFRLFVCAPPQAAIAESSGRRELEAAVYVSPCFADAGRVVRWMLRAATATSKTTPAKTTPAKTTACNQRHCGSYLTRYGHSYSQTFRRPAKCLIVGLGALMEMEQFLTELISSEAGTVLKSGLKLVHLLGIAIGLGAATVLDLVIVRFLVTRTIAREFAAVVVFCSKIVTAGLVLLWLSGLGFLIHYSVFEPEKLGNPKIWAKIAIVGVLTLNGFFIHQIVLPLVKARIGQSLFAGLGARQRIVLLASGTVSATSWYVPLILGAFPQFNFVLPATTILLGYFVILSAAIFGVQLLALTLFDEFRYETLLRHLVMWTPSYWFPGYRRYRTFAAGGVVSIGCAGFMFIGPSLHPQALAKSPAAAKQTERSGAHVVTAALEPQTASPGVDNATCTIRQSRWTSNMGALMDGPRPRAFPGPALGQPVLLADAHLVLEPHFYRCVWREFLANFRNAYGKVF